MITVVINTYNAEQFLQEVLDSVKDFDEIVVCDMESTDHTVEIAERNGCKVYTFPKGHHKIPEPARDFAIHKASNPWVLVVDSDEIVTPQLRQYLYDHCLTNDGVNGYYISRLNKFMGKYMFHSSHDHILRFFRQEKATWAPTIHSQPVIEGEIEVLPDKYHLLHLADENVAQWVNKMNDYTDSEIARKGNKKWGIGALIWRSTWRFLRNFILTGGFLNGKRGFLQAVQWSIYQQILVSKVIEKRLREKI